MKLALCQLRVTENKANNLRRCREMLYKAADGGAKMALLPEMFTIAYVTSLFLRAAESCPNGETGLMLQDIARETGMFIVGGSIPEVENGLLYNTSMSFSADGTFEGKYRKAHLFDIDVPGVFRFMESEVISRGDNYPLVLNNAPIKTGVMICFDIRFPEWSRLLMEQQVDLIAVPAAFARTTGPRHWELLMRARALDNQVFVAAVSPAQSPNAYGHSLIATPDGTVLHDCLEDEACAIIELDYEMLEQMRYSIPVRANRRKDLY